MSGGSYAFQPTAPSFLTLAVAKRLVLSPSLIKSVIAVRSMVPSPQPCLSHGFVYILTSQADKVTSARNVASFFGSGSEIETDSLEGCDEP